MSAKRCAYRDVAHILAATIACKGDIALHRGSDTQADADGAAVHSISVTHNFNDIGRLVKFVSCLER